MREKFTVTGMTCSACSAHVDKAVRKLPGVSEVNVNLLGGSMTVDWQGELTADEINWINAYHQAVYEKLSPMLNDEERAWLKDKTEAIA